MVFFPSIHNNYLNIANIFFLYLAKKFEFMNLKMSFVSFFIFVFKHVVI